MDYGEEVSEGLESVALGLLRIWLNCLGATFIKRLACDSEENAIYIGGEEGLCRLMLMSGEGFLDAQGGEAQRGVCSRAVLHTRSSDGNANQI